MAGELKGLNYLLADNASNYEQPGRDFYFTVIWKEMLKFVVVVLGISCFDLLYNTLFIILFYNLTILLLFYSMLIVMICA